jgi:hypothetical protein
MSLKPIIHHRVAVESVANRVANEYRSVIDASRLTQPLYTVLSYPGMQGESSSIVNSKSASKALAKAQSQGDPIVAVAHNFTSEALELLQSHGAIVFRMRDHHWSDASYASLCDKI